jgi:carboxyvinyl-carboxyphosphonate phosphorylmutase
MSEAREYLRSVLAGEDCVVAANIYDPLSARIAEILGWRLIYLAGSVAKAAELAAPDDGAIADPRDLADICGRITRAVGASLVVDADDGGGSILRLQRTIRDLEAAGVAGIEIADDVNPATLTYEGSRHGMFVSKGEHEAMLRAAVAARADTTTVIVARTSALNELPREEALDRISMYPQTGAEAVVLPHWPPGGREDIEGVSAACGLPMYVITPPPDVVRDKKFLAQNKVRIAIYGNWTTKDPTPYRAAVRGIYESLARLRGGEGRPWDGELPTDLELLAAVSRRDEFEERERRFSSGADERANA